MWVGTIRNNTAKLKYGFVRTQLEKVRTDSVLFCFTILIYSTLILMKKQIQV